MIKSFFARVWALWGLLSFVATFLLILIPSMISHLFKDEKKGQIYFMVVSRIWMRVWLTLIGCRLIIKGKEKFASAPVFIVTFNHRSLLDVPLSAPFVPGGNKTIGKISFAKVPLFGWFYSRGAVLVDRNKESSRRKSYEQMHQVLRLGIHMCVYPEGTRNRGKELLKPFFDGAFRLSKETGVPIMPCIIRGTADAMPIHKAFYLLPKKLSLEFLDSMNPQNYPSVTELKAAVFESMHANLSSK
jgi:1-acyl-sn-glycerol-3-phosphate acyltransferase